MFSKCALPMTMVLGASAGMTTCGDLKDFYKAQQCCGVPSQELTTMPNNHGGGCPYNFAVPKCEDAEVQSPRDLSPGASGNLLPKAATLTVAQTASLPMVNVHWHLGAEHKTDDYKDGSLSVAYDNAHSSSGDGIYRRRLGEDVRPGWMCDSSTLPAAAIKPYTFQYCKGQMEVGHSYEVHYVHSSAGYTADELVGADVDGIDDGLGGAANGRGQLNPFVTVKGIVYHIVHDDAAAENVDYEGDLWTAFETLMTNSNSVMYPGSTTGTSVNNEYCSPYAITWHVHKECVKVRASQFDNMCKKMMDEFNMESDLYPHGSRILLSEDWVVPASYVKPLA